MASATASTRSRGRPPGEWQNQLPSDLFDDAAFCSLNAPQRLILIDCIRRADRHGRGMARPSQVRTTALDGLGLSVEQTAGLLADVPGLMAGSKFELLMYEVDRNQFYAFPRWLEFQNIEYVPKSSRFPPPPGCTDDEPPSTPPGTDGSADLPPGPGRAAGVPTTGAAPVRGAQDQAQLSLEQGSADLPAGEPDEPTDWIRWYEQKAAFPSQTEIARVDELKQKGVTDDLIIAALKEARENKANRPVRYAHSIISGLLNYGVKTRAQWEAHRKEQEVEHQKRARAPARGRSKSNVFLGREKKDESYYEHIYNKFQDPDADPKPPPEATEVN